MLYRDMQYEVIVYVSKWEGEERKREREGERERDKKINVKLTTHNHITYLAVLDLQDDVAGNVREPIEGNLQLYAPATYIYMKHAIEQRAYTKTSNYKLDTTSTTRLSIITANSPNAWKIRGGAHDPGVCYTKRSSNCKNLWHTEYVKISITNGQFFWQLTPLHSGVGREPAASSWWVSSLVKATAHEGNLKGRVDANFVGLHH